MSKKTKKTVKKKKSGNSFWRKQGLIFGLLIGSIIFLPSTMLLLVGMMPTIVASLIDKTKERLKGVTVGCMNFSACFPFWLDLVRAGHTPEASLAIISNPITIIVMYIGAIAGYMIEWGLSGVIAKLVIQNAKTRLKKIASLKASLIERWGREVTGDLPVDQLGFPIEQTEPPAK